MEASLAVTAPKPTTEAPDQSLALNEDSDHRLAALLVQGERAPVLSQSEKDAFADGLADLCSMFGLETYAGTKLLGRPLEGYLDRCNDLKGIKLRPHDLNAFRSLLEGASAVPGLLNRAKDAVVRAIEQSTHDGEEYQTYRALASVLDWAKPEGVVNFAEPFMRIMVTKTSLLERQDLNTLFTLAGLRLDQGVPLHGPGSGVMLRGPRISAVATASLDTHSHDISARLLKEYNVPAPVRPPPPAGYGAQIQNSRPLRGQFAESLELALRTLGLDGCRINTSQGTDLQDPFWFIEYAY